MTSFKLAIQVGQSTNLFHQSNKAFQPETVINRDSTENQSSGANTSYTTMEEMFNIRLIHIYLLSEALVFSETDFEYQNKVYKVE